MKVLVISGPGNGSRGHGGWKIHKPGRLDRVHVWAVAGIGRGGGGGGGSGDHMTCNVPRFSMCYFVHSALSITTNGVFLDGIGGGGALRDIYTPVIFN